MLPLPSTLAPKPMGVLTLTTGERKIVRWLISM